MAEYDKLDLFFGQDSSRIKRTCQEISLLEDCNRQLTENRNKLIRNRQNIHLAHKADRSTVENELQNVRKNISELERKRKPIWLKQAELDKRLTTLNGRLGLIFESIFTLNFDRTNELRAISKTNSELIEKYDSEMDDLGAQEKEINRKISQLDAPIQDIDFATGYISADVIGNNERLKQLDKRINDILKQCASSISIAAWRHKSARLSELAGENIIVEVLRLKTLLHQYESLKAIPDLPSRSSIEFEHDHVYDAVEKGFEKATSKAHCQIRMAGSGHAHKKVRSGKSTTWKRVRVNLSGTIHPKMYLHYPQWNPSHSCHSLAYSAESIFLGNYMTKRRQKTENEQVDLEVEIKRQVQKLREILQLP